MTRHTNASVVFSAILMVASAATATAQEPVSTVPASGRMAIPRVVPDPMSALPDDPLVSLFDPAAPIVPAEGSPAPSTPGADGVPSVAMPGVTSLPPTTLGTSAAEMRNRVDSATTIPGGEANPFGAQFGGAFSGQSGLMEQDRRARLIDELAAIVRSRRDADAADGTLPAPAPAGAQVPVLPR